MVGGRSHAFAAHTACVLTNVTHSHKTSFWCDLADQISRQEVPPSPKLHYAIASVEVVSLLLDLGPVV